MASQSWQHAPLLPVVSAQGHIRHLPHLTRTEEPTMRSHETYQWLLRSVFFFFSNFTAVKGNQAYANVFNTTFANSGAWIWGWHCLLVQSFQRVRLTFLFHLQTGMQLWHPLHPDTHQHFRNHEGTACDSKQG